jgi:RNA polymerase sigma factor (sigma-70 family)
MEYRSFEDSINIINLELKKRQSNWTLSSIQYMDYDDISQIIRIHIFQKWHLYDQTKPLEPWLNKIISHQIKNIMRNIYGNYARPCNKCSAAGADESCSIYKKQCSDCPLFAFWEKKKKPAHELVSTLQIENHINDKVEDFHHFFDIEQAAEKIHKIMEGKLKPKEWRIYKMLFIDNIPEEEVAKAMKYKCNEVDRSRSKQLKNIQKRIIEKVKKAMENNEIDI